LVKNNHRIVLRADGNSIIGLGHVIRLLGLFEFIKNEFDCVFLIRKPELKLKHIIGSYCRFLILEGTLKDEIEELSYLLDSNDIVVLDGYYFDEEYQQYIKSKVHKLVMIDDKAEAYFYADLVINHGGALMKAKYKTEPYTRLLLGTDYLILRNEFLEAALTKRIVTKVDSVFICMGGADPFNITIKALKASIKCDFISRIIVITGSAYSNNDDLKKALVEAPRSKDVLYENNVNPSRLVELIRMCEIAICPSSSIALEVCCVKAGLLTGIVTDNQESIHNMLVSSDCCLSLNDFNETSVESIQVNLYRMNNVDYINTLIKNQSENIDGLSGRRFLQEFKLL